jgi:hypothetical protein
MQGPIDKCSPAGKKQDLGGLGIGVSVSYRKDKTVAGGSPSSALEI